MRPLQYWILALLCALPAVGLYAYFEPQARFLDEQRAQAEWDWARERQALIDSSPTVFITPTGEKYHRLYHYHNRTRPLSLYEASEQHYEACRVLPLASS